MTKPVVTPQPTTTQISTFGKVMALAAALLGWMFDGLEMGLFPLVARPAMQDLLQTTDDAVIGNWIGVITAAFLVGAATGGVFFGWLGDRIGRVRAMILSVLAYTIFTGLCAVAVTGGQLALLRFLAALGMGGEWSLGVALVMEVWQVRSRGFLAGLIGAAANVGFLGIAVISIPLVGFLGDLSEWLASTGLPQNWVDFLTAHDGWRLLMVVGAAPALLTFLIRLFVPESESWQREHSTGSTSAWATRDLLGVAIGAAGAMVIVYLWADRGPELQWPTAVRITGTVLGVIVAAVGFTYPVIRFLQRSVVPGADSAGWRPVIGRMLLGAMLSGIALLGTWGSLQWAATWAHKLSEGTDPDGYGQIVAVLGSLFGLAASTDAKAYTQIAAGLGAILGTIGGAMLGDLIGRRPTYVVLCLASVGSILLLYQTNDQFGDWFLFCAFVAGACTASFYGWLPLYLPELFRTRVRATGQGFSFNFGRIIAAVGVLQTGALMGLFDGGYPQACSIMGMIYLLGPIVIWLAPETRGLPLPE